MVGEFNAGKSAFINALLGSRVLAEGVTPTTSQINVLQYGELVERHVREPNLHVITAPAPLLREIHIVDTPGTNAIIREHEAITVAVRAAVGSGAVRDVRRSPLHRDRTRVFLEQVRDWGKKVVVVINKVDILESARRGRGGPDVRRDNARALLGFSPEIFPVSAQLALRAKQGEPQAWPAAASRRSSDYIATTLDAPGRRAAEAAEPARRRRVAGRAPRRIRHASGWRC